MIELAVILLIAGLMEGSLGSLVGVGPGIFVVPFLVLVLAVDIRVAVATSLIAVIATSTAAMSAHLDTGLINTRLGMALEIPTTLGAVAGGLVASLLPPAVVAGAFGVVAAATAVLVGCNAEPATERPRSGHADSIHCWEENGRLAGAYFDTRTGSFGHYEVVRVAFGSGVSLVAGVTSGVLGVGGGLLKVPAMTLGMAIPIKVAAATSNFMIGVTALASIAVYFAKGDVDPFLAAPVALGVLTGTLYGSALGLRLSGAALHWILACALAFAAVEMLLKAAG
jgi:uncharacterized protein